jgi:hypothetical protein
MPQRLKRSHEPQRAGVVGGLEAVKEEATEETGEDADRQKESGATRDPPSAVGREATARDDTVQVRMMHEGLSPTVQDGEEADLCAEMLGIGGDGAQGLGGRAKQEAIDLRFVLEGDGCDVVGGR